MKIVSNLGNLFWKDRQGRKWECVNEDDKEEEGERLRRKEGKKEREEGERESEVGTYEVAPVVN